MAAWAPWTHADIDCLETVQKRAVRAMSGLKGTTYEEKLLEISLPSLMDRRREIDLIQTFKIVNNIDTDNSEILLERADTGTRRPTTNYGGRDNLIVKRS